MIPEAYKAYVQINGKWELIAWSYRFEQFKERLSEAKKGKISHDYILHVSNHWQIF
jgi:hypothetical protein